jgi:hypothetical protein
MMAERIANTTSMACFGRACRGEHYSGDVAIIREHDTGTLLAIVDAAGHGRSAHAIATKAETILKSESCGDLVALIQSLHRQLAGSHGAVIIAGILDADCRVFKYVHIGDAHGKVFGPRRRSMIGQMGMLGQAIRTPKIRSETLSAGDTLVLCTDGISERYDLAEIQQHRTIPTAALTRHIVKQIGKDHDDATCIVVRCG